MQTPPQFQNINLLTRYMHLWMIRTVRWCEHRLIEVPPPKYYIIISKHGKTYYTRQEENLNYASASWRFDIDDICEIQTTNIDKPINIKDRETGCNQTVQAIDTTTPYKLLGVQMCLNGDDKHQAKALQQKCNHIMIAYQCWKKTPDNAWQGYQSMYIPAIRYQQVRWNYNRYSNK